MDIATIIEEIDENGYYTCDCGNNVEPDGTCECGISNPLKDKGLI